jgi:signal transduction histidine kinase/DNA-binding response OmpR family regulator
MESGLGAQAPARCEAKGAPARILFVDDDDATRCGVGALLREEGFLVDLATDGEQGLRIARERAPDVVVTDYRMPGMSGVDFCARLHEMDPDLPVILVTALRDPESVVLGMRAGAQDFLEKPLQPETVVATVLEALERRSARRLKRASERPARASEPVPDVRDQLARVARELRNVNERLVVSSIREREQAEAESRERAQLAALLRNLNEGVLIAGADGRVRMVNAAARAALCEGDEPLETLEDVASLNVRTIDGAPMPLSARPLARALSGEDFKDYEVLRAGAARSTRRLSTSGTSVKDADGRVALAIVVLRDITELRRLERQREEYATLVSHDLRTPLGSIHLLAATLVRGAASSREEITDAALRIQANVARMNGMVQEILEASQLESRTLDLRFEPCDLRTVVAGIVARLDDVRRRRVSLEAADAPFAVSADVRRLERAITNLIANALKYSPEDAPVTVELARDGASVVLRVIDRGVGIAREELPRLFDRYYRAPGVKPIEGLGLGLYITSLLVQAHGGRIDADSAPGKGSAFTLVLPADGGK